MTARCEECEGVGTLDEDGLCVSCAWKTPPLPYWSPVGRPGASAWGPPRGPVMPPGWEPPPAGARRCENCGGGAAVNDDGLCTICSADTTAQRSAMARAELGRLTAQAHEAVTFARRHGTVPMPERDGELSCTRCGRWLDRVEADDFDDLCIRCADEGSPR